MTLLGVVAMGMIPTLETKTLLGGIGGRMRDRAIAMNTDTNEIMFKVSKLAESVDTNICASDAERSLPTSK